jgi:hypothetical protein
MQKNYGSGDYEFAGREKDEGMMDDIKQLILAQCEEYQGRYASTPCLVWTSNKMPNGYGRINYRGRRWLVHRLAYECFVGPIPDGMQVNHSCNVRDCCSPEHLELGTHEINMEQMVRDGRSCAGIAHGRAALSSKDAIEVLRLVGKGWSFAPIAHKLGVDQNVIRDIATGRTYKDIPGERRSAHSPTNRFFGVSYHKLTGKWRARLRLDGKLKELGYFGHELLAAICVNAHIAYLGLDLPLNTIPEGEWCHD